IGRPASCRVDNWDVNWVRERRLMRPRATRRGRSATPPPAAPPPPRALVLPGRPAPRAPPWEAGILGVARSLPPLDHHGFADDFFNRGDAVEDGVEAAFAEGPHPLATRLVAQFVGRDAVQDHLPKRLRHHEELVDRRAAAIAGSVAESAALAVR